MLGCRRPPRELPSCSTPCSSSFSFPSNSTVEIFFARQKREAIFARYINRLCRLRSCMFEKGQMKIVLPTECFRCGCRIDLSTRGKRVKALCVCVCVCVCPPVPVRHRNRRMCLPALPLPVPALTWPGWQLHGCRCTASGRFVDIPPFSHRVSFALLST